MILEGFTEIIVMGVSFGFGLGLSIVLIGIGIRGIINIFKHSI